MWIKCFTCTNSVYTSSNPLKGIRLSPPLARWGKGSRAVKSPAWTHMTSDAKGWDSNPDLVSPESTIQTSVFPQCHLQCAASLLTLLLDLQGLWTLTEQCSPWEHKVKSIRRCQEQVSQAFKLLARRRQMDLQEFLLLPRGHSYGSTAAISIMTTLFSAAGPLLPVPVPELVAASYGSHLLHAPLESADSQVHLLGKS